MAYRNDLSQLKNQATYNNDLMSLVFDNITDEELKMQYPPQPMHPNAIDITGQKFGKLTALWKVGNQRKGHSSTPIFAFRCDCGKIKFSTSQMARTNQITSRGCGAQDRGKQKQLNLLGKKFGRLTVIKQLPSENRSAHWLCQCECGNQITANQADLFWGSVTDCGCQKKKRTNITGQRFGKLIALRETEPGTSRSGVSISRWLCRCDCGRELVVRKNNLTGRVTRSCGCLRSQKARFSATR